MGNPSSPTLRPNCENGRACFYQTCPGLHVWGVLVPIRIDEFRMLWLPWATHRKVWHKMEVWTATRAGWPSKRPFCAILFYVSPRATKACESRLYIDNLQNYCLGTRYGARSRSRLCRRLSISLVRYRHGLEKFLEHHFIPIRRRFNPHDPPTDLLRVQDPFFFGEERRSFRQETSMAWHGLFLCGRSSLI